MKRIMSDSKETKYVNKQLQLNWVEGKSKPTNGLIKKRKCRRDLF